MHLDLYGFILTYVGFVWTDVELFGLIVSKNWKKRQLAKGWVYSGFITLHSSETNLTEIYSCRSLWRGLGPHDEVLYNNLFLEFPG